MKAMVWTAYGRPEEVLRLQEVEKPAPGDGEVLVRVHAASINSWDWDLFTARYSLIRGGRPNPRYRILGCDVAGVVEAAGRNARRFKPGDEVFGDTSRFKWGGFAEFVCADETAFALKSPKMSFAEAASLPQAAGLVLQALRDKGMIEAGQNVLVNGGGGGVGTFAIQLARYHGARVTAVDRAEKLEAMRSLGADRVMDYAKEDFTRDGQRYDLILDVVATRSIFDYKRALAPNGRCVLLGGELGKLFQALFFGSWMLGSRKVKLLLYRQNPADIETIREMFEKGILRPVIDRCYPLDRTAEAFRYFAGGTFKGKIVVTVREPVATGAVPA
jgi:NADPH:quinone reductase-like Zn-dependent oxidoreductase